MDPSAYLKQRGWRGLGYSLDRHDRGLAKPLLTSRKDDNLGIGLKKQAAGAVSDEWWLRALDEGLKDMGSGKPKAIPLTGPKHAGTVIYGSSSGLSGYFVKGEVLGGSIGEVSTTGCGAGAVAVGQTKVTTAVVMKENGTSTSSLTSTSTSVKSASLSAADTKAATPATTPEDTDTKPPSAVTLKRKRKDKGEKRLKADARKRKRGECKERKVREESAKALAKGMSEPGKQKKNGEEQGGSNITQGLFASAGSRNGRGLGFRAASADEMEKKEVSEKEEDGEDEAVVAEVNHMHADRLALLNGSTKTDKNGFNRLSGKDNGKDKGTRKNIKPPVLDMDNSKTKTMGKQLLKKSSSKISRPLKTTPSNSNRPSAHGSVREELHLNRKLSNNNASVGTELDINTLQIGKRTESKKSRKDLSAAGQKESKAEKLSASGDTSQSTKKRKPRHSKEEKPGSKRLEHSGSEDDAYEDVSIKPMSRKKKENYTARATAKGVTLGDYLKRRAVKKEKQSRKL